MSWRGFDPWVRKTPWRREWPPTPVFSPTESRGQRSLAGHSPRGCKELDTTEGLSTHSTRRSGDVGVVCFIFIPFLYLRIIAWYSFLIFLFSFILLYNTVLVLPYMNMNPPRVYTCSQSWTPLPPPSLYQHDTVLRNLLFRCVILMILGYRKK